MSILRLGRHRTRRQDTLRVRPGTDQPRYGHALGGRMQRVKEYGTYNVGHWFMENVRGGEMTRLPACTGSAAITVTLDYSASIAIVAVQC